MTAPILQIRNLRAWYGQTQALFDVSLDVPQGGISTLLGANGAGKTTTLRAICGLIRREGSITFDGQDIARLDTAAIVRRGIAHVPDGRGTFAELSVEENLRLGAFTIRDKAAVAQATERVLTYFPILRERFRQQAGTLSGGEQQMLAIGRALMLRPRLMVLDEPSFGLAPLIVAEIFRIMRRINAEEKVAILLVEQNARLALDLADRAFLLQTGSVVLSGAAAELKQDAGVQRAYLGVQGE
ncbi:ABC transporter ATP-binding protein [Gemmobacter sp.]|uniref:ABC transporter ATP-binding protein n=1 Tax=Gemmobacter sp. TaxID=1898957 RepID=UPI002B002383|nr:ABC transporter ATP-binding protein [Gemmobacter sp.]